MILDRNASFYTEGAMTKTANISAIEINFKRKTRDLSLICVSRVRTSFSLENECRHVPAESRVKMFIVGPKNQTRLAWLSRWVSIDLLETPCFSSRQYR